MRDRKPPRYQGKITSWKDEQGFGFITPNGGGAQVFVHVKAFDSRGRRPAENDLVTYELGTNGKGQARAGNVAFVAGRDAARTSRPGRAGGVLGAGAVLMLAMLAAVAALPGKLPYQVPAFYLAASITAYIAYAVDKSAARAGRRRTPESTLHLLGLFGGWPGALLAQRVLRHKSSKQSFQRIFWLTVAVNCAVFGWLVRNVF